MQKRLAVSKDSKLEHELRVEEIKGSGRGPRNSAKGPDPEIRSLALKKPHSSCSKEQACRAHVSWKKLQKNVQLF